ncbi:MAG TPA: homoserine kinase [Anaerolineaceae bacterium]|jgi:homoserine kinase
METRTITIRVPATTANLGPGFDCLGLALDLWNEASFSTEGEGVRMDIHGLGVGVLPEGPENTLAAQALYLISVCGKPIPPNLLIRCENRIPPGSGLGSSAAAVLTGLLGGNALIGSPLSMDEILQLAVEAEGHPDNAGAALLGGLVLSARLDNGVVARKVPVAALQAAVVTPDFNLPTHQARSALPRQVPLADAVFNLGRTALTIEALRSGDLELLGQAMQDRLHQPYRLRLIPGAEQAFQSALTAGAAAVAISGAGPSVIAFASKNLEQIAKAMQTAFAGAGLLSRSAILAITELGAQVLIQD